MKEIFSKNPNYAFVSIALAIATVISSFISVHALLICLLLTIIAPPLSMTSHWEKETMMSYMGNIIVILILTLILVFASTSTILLKNEINNNGGWIVSGKIIYEGHNRDGSYTIVEGNNCFGEKTKFCVYYSTKRKIGSEILIGTPVNYRNSTLILKDTLTDSEKEKFSLGMFLKNGNPSTKYSEKFASEQFEYYKQIKQSKIPYFIEENVWYLGAGLILLCLAYTYFACSVKYVVYCIPFVFITSYQWYFGYFSFVPLPVLYIIYGGACLITSHLKGNMKSIIDELI